MARADSCLNPQPGNAPNQLFSSILTAFSRVKIRFNERSTRLKFTASPSAVLAEGYALPFPHTVL